MSGKRGFSLLEISATLMLVFAVGAIAIPYYRHAQGTAAARACLANIKTIARAEAVFAERNGHFTTNVSELVGAPKALRALPQCPLDSKPSYIATSGKDRPVIVIRCPHAAEHSDELGAKSDYATRLTMADLKTYLR